MNFEDEAESTTPLKNHLSKGNQEFSANSSMEVIAVDKRRPGPIVLAEIYQPGIDGIQRVYMLEQIYPD